MRKIVGWVLRPLAIFVFDRHRFGCSVGLMACMGGGTAAAQAIRVESIQADGHRVTKPAAIRVKSDLRISGDIGVEVTVDTAGKVVSAHATKGPAEFFRQAEEAEGKQKFQPFERHGAAVQATFVDFVSIEEWAAQSVPFGEVKNWDSLRMIFTRGGCWTRFAQCPAYEVTIHGDGRVEFLGRRGVLLTGQHWGMVSKEAVAELLERFRAVDYFSLQRHYRARITDATTNSTGITFDARSMTVEDYVGTEAGMPRAVRDLEEAIDKAADTERWIKENAGTEKLLLDERWNFRADTIENRELFSNVSVHGSEDLVRMFVANGAPVFNDADPLRSPLAEATRAGRLAAIKIFVEERQQTKEALSCALGVAAEAGNLQLVRYFVQKGGEPNGPLCGRYEHRATVLMNAVRSGDPEVVKEILNYHPDLETKQWDGRAALAVFLSESPGKANEITTLNLLLAAGADVNSADYQGRTPIFHACHKGAEFIRILAKAGAEVNAKDRQGETALTHCMNDDSLRALAAAGAVQK